MDRQKKLQTLLENVPPKDEVIFFITGDLQVMRELGTGQDAELLEVGKKTVLDIRGCPMDLFSLRQVLSAQMALEIHDEAAKESKEINIWVQFGSVEPIRQISDEEVRGLFQVPRAEKSPAKPPKDKQKAKRSLIGDGTRVTTASCLIAASKRNAPKKAREG